MKSWVKAGLIGGGVLGIFTILSTFSWFLPQLGRSLYSCANCCLFALLYPAVGVLAAYWMPPNSLPAEGAKFGALAGLIAGIIDSGITIITATATAFLGGPDLFFRGFSPEEVSYFQEIGLDNLVSPGGMIGSALCSSVFFLVFAIGAGALSGFIYFSIKNKNRDLTDEAP